MARLCGNTFPGLTFASSHNAFISRQMFVRLIGMLQNLGLQNIQIRLLPASTMYKHYIDNTKFNLQSLNL